MNILSAARLFQYGYVTTDLEAGMARARTLFGVGDYLAFEVPSMRVALGWVGDAMIEVIEPNPAHPGIYGAALRPDCPLSFHHLGHLVAPDVFETLPGRLADADIAVPSANLLGGVRFLYADLVADCGHFFEFVEDGPDWAQLSARVPR